MQIILLLLQQKKQVKHMTTVMYLALGDMGQARGHSGHELLSYL